MLNRLYLSIRRVIMRNRLEREMQEEMALHIEQATARFVAAGMSAHDARRAAIREFGNFDYIEEDARDARRNRWIDALRGDVRFAWRHFRRTPLSTLTMIVVLSLGIGVNTALFTMVHALRSLPPAGMERDETHVRIRGIDVVRGGSLSGLRVERLMSYPEARAYADRRDVFQDVAIFTTAEFALDVAGSGSGPTAGRGAFVTDDYFRLLNIRPVVGAGLPVLAPNADASSALVSVISYYLWQSQFNGAPDVIGRTIKVNNVATSIVGVAPPMFLGTSHTSSTKNVVWLPLAARTLIFNTGNAALSSPDSTRFRVLARLQPNVSVETATQRARAVAGVMSARNRLCSERSQCSADVAPLLAANNNVSQDGARLTEAAAGGALSLLILLITCTNVSALLLGLSLARRREIAVRLSLGASRARIIRQLLTESACLAVAAGLLGVSVLWIVRRALIATIPDVEQLLLVDVWAVVFTFGFALGTGVLFGLSPALHATRVAVAEVLKDAATAVSLSRSWLHRGLIVMQIALTQPLLVGLGATVLIIMGDAKAFETQTSYERIAQVRLDVFSGNVPMDQRKADVARLAERIAAMPGVVAAVPFDDGHMRTVHVHPADRVETSSLPDSMMAEFVPALPGYFDLMEIDIIRGRDLQQDDTRQRYGAAVISAADARALFGNEDPIGKRLGFERDSAQLTIVGVADAPPQARSGDARMRVYVPWTVLMGEVLVRTEGPAEPMIPAIRSVALAEVPYMPVSSIMTLDDIQRSMRRMLVQATSAAAAGGLLALLLSALGLYGVIAFAVAQRTREIGIRTALGAAREQVVRMFFMAGIRVALLGLVLGLPLSILALRLLANTFGMPAASSPVLAAMIAAAVITVAGLATWIPSRRAAGVDPLRALRAE